jgi:serine/threonine-protein kinase HipA
LYPDGRAPVLSPAYDFVATFPYIPGDKLALNFGGSQSLNEVTVDQVRRFTDTARLPMSPIWEIVRETIKRTEAAWKTLDQKDLLPSEMRRAIGRQIQAVAAKTETEGGARKAMPQAATASKKSARATRRAVL